MATPLYRCSTPPQPPATPPALADAPVLAHVRARRLRRVGPPRRGRGHRARRQPPAGARGRSTTRSSRGRPTSRSRPSRWCGPGCGCRRSTWRSPRASHSGEDFHLAAVREMLAAAGLTEADLQNTPDYPVDEDERERLAARRPRRTLPITQNCSGKHAAMLATCVVNGWDTATYRDPDHPLQQAIAATLGRARPATRRRHGGRRLRRARHGRDASPAWPARSAASPPRRRAPTRPTVADAIRAHPELPRRHPPRRHRPHRGDAAGSIAKDGAEAVYAVGLADGRGVAVKIADGYPRAKPVILAAVLRRARRRVAAPSRSSRTPRSSATASRSAPSSPSASEAPVRAVLQRVTQRLGHRRRRGRRGDRPPRACWPSSASTHDDGPDQVETMARKIARPADPARRALGRSTTARRCSSSASSPSTPTPARAAGRRGTPPRPGRWPSRSSRHVVAALRERGVEVATGRFGADMEVSLVNDGPVTLVLDV